MSKEDERLDALCYEYETRIDVYHKISHDKALLKELIRLAHELNAAGIMVDPYDPENDAAGRWSIEYDERKKNEKKKRWNLFD